MTPPPRRDVPGRRVALSRGELFVPEFVKLQDRVDVVLWFHGAASVAQQEFYDARKDAVLFVAARDPKSPGPPFAVRKLAANFPVEVDLTAADAMMESRRISAGQQLDVVARIALGGTPTASSGDPFGQVSYHVGKDGRLNIVIDRLAP